MNEKHLPPSVICPVPPPLESSLNILFIEDQKDQDFQTRVSNEWILTRRLVRREVGMNTCLPSQMRREEREGRGRRENELGRPLLLPPVFSWDNGGRHLAQTEKGQGNSHYYHHWQGLKEIFPVSQKKCQPSTAFTITTSPTPSLPASLGEKRQVIPFSPSKWI